MAYHNCDWCSRRFEGSSYTSDDSGCRYCSKRCANEAEGIPFDSWTRSCFITTATCKADNLPDDCHSLTALRAFRDDWMSATAARRALVTQYYALAPQMVERINARPDRDEFYAMLRDRFILPAVARVDVGDANGAETVYTEMMTWLGVQLG